MIDNLKAFAAVIDCKSLTKAASRLFLTQSAISRRIQQLEEALGGTLLDRTQRPPSCTALGQRVYEQSLPILRAVDDLMTLTRQDAAPTGTLRFGMSQAIGDVIMADAVEQLSGEFPTLDVRMRAGWGAPPSRSGRRRRSGCRHRHAARRHPAGSTADHAEPPAPA